MIISNIRGWSLASILRVDKDDYKRLAAVVCFALAVRIVWTLVFQTAPASDAAAYDGLAWRLAEGYGYVAANGAPTAFWPVGYPAFLSAIYTVFGHSWLAAGVANALLGSISVALTYRLAREFLPCRPSILAAALMALIPSHIVSFTAVLLTQSLHTVFVLLILIAILHLTRSPNWRRATILGLVIGVGVYVRPIMLLFPSVVFILLFMRECKLGRALALSCTVLAVALLVILPWTTRNFLVMGEPILTATNGCYNFYVGNGPGATGEHRAISDSRFADFSQLDWHREGCRMGLEHIVNHPDEWIVILPKKFFHLWASDKSLISPNIIPESYRGIFVPILWVVAQGYWTVIVVAASAAAVSRPIWSYWLKFPVVLIPLTLAYWTAFYMMFFGTGAYHAEMIPLVIIIAVHLLKPGQNWRAWLPSLGQSSRFVRLRKPQWHKLRTDAI